MSQVRLTSPFGPVSLDELLCRWRFVFDPCFVVSDHGAPLVLKPYAHSTTGSQMRPGSAKRLISCRARWINPATVRPAAHRAAARSCSCALASSVATWRACLGYSRWPWSVLRAWPLTPSGDRGLLAAGSAVTTALPQALLVVLRTLEKIQKTVERFDQVLQAGEFRRHGWSPWVKEWAQVRLSWSRASNVLRCGARW